MLPCLTKNSNRLEQILPAAIFFRRNNRQSRYYLCGCTFKEDRFMRWLFCASLLAAMTGCRAYSLDVDGRIEERATTPTDVRVPEERPPMLPDLPPKPAPGGGAKI